MDRGGSNYRRAVLATGSVIVSIGSKPGRTKAAPTHHRPAERPGRLPIYKLVDPCALISFFSGFFTAVLRNAARSERLMMNFEHDSIPPNGSDELKLRPGAGSKPAVQFPSAAVRSEPDYPVRSVPLSAIRADHRVQARAQISLDVIEEYARAMGEENQFPPLVVFAASDDTYFLADGFHRHRAAEQNGREALDCEIKPGSLREAILYAAGANTAHGLQRSTDDKRKAVSTLLSDEEWRQWSDREIARHCNVGHQLVAKLRASAALLTGPRTSEQAKRKFRTRQGTVAHMVTAKIGKKRKSAVAAQHECPNTVHDGNQNCGDQQLGQEEALAILREFTNFIMARISRRGKDVAITVAEEDVHEFDGVLSRAKMML
jgi:hypothetical protein